MFIKPWDKFNIEKSSCKRAFFVLLFFILLLSNIPGAAAKGRVEWKPVKVACNINKALYLDHNVNPQGYCLKFLKALAGDNHWIVQYVPGTWAGSVAALEKGEIDILFPTQKTPERLNTMNFSQMIGGYQLIGLFGGENKEFHYNDYDSFNGAKIAVTQNSSNEVALQEFARNHNFTYTPVYIASVNGKVEALENGNADLIAVSSLSNNTGLNTVAIMSYEPFYFTTNKNNTALMKEIDESTAHIMAGHPEITSEMYRLFLEGGNNLALTRSEREWVRTHKKLVIACYKDTPPMYHEKGGEDAHGIFVDVLTLLAKKSGLEIEIKPLDRSQYAYNLLDEGIIDMVIGSNDLSLDLQGNNRYIHTSSLMPYNTVAVSKVNYNPGTNDKPVYILTSGRKYWEPYILQKHPQAKIIYEKTPKDCLIAVEDGKADVTMLNTWEYNYFTKSNRFSNLIEWENDRVNASLVIAALGKGDPNIISIMEKTIAKVTPSEVEEIINSNLNRPYDDYTFTDRVYGMGPLIMTLAAILIMTVIGLIVYNVLRKKYVNELEANNAQLKIANDTKDLFLSRISHELRTPLNAIAGNAALLKDYFRERPGEKGKEFEEVEDIQKAETYLQRIINGILDTRQLADGEFVLTPEINSATEFLNGLALKYQELAKQKGVEFVAARLTNVSDYYRGDGVRIEQILDNLLSNALKFTPTGGRITCTAQASPLQEDNTIEVKFTVTDTGIGMSKEFVEEHLFQAFKKENEGMKSSYEGVGMGLKVCRMLARNMGGDISCVSEPGQGSTFTFTAKVEPVDEKTVAALKQSKERAEESDFSGKKVLICEDNLINQRMLTKLLEKKHCESTIAVNGKEGLDIFHNSKEGYFDIVLMDLRMPELDGYEATKAIRQLNRKDAKSIPIIAVSANAYAQDIAQAIAVGMNAHLTKPVNIRELYATMGKFISKNS